MVFYNLNKDLIKLKSHLDSGSYIYELGTSVQITVMRKRNSTDILSRVLCAKVKEDRFMIRFIPINKVIFDSDVIDTDISCSNLSYEIDTNLHAVRIGAGSKYFEKSGVFTFSSECKLTGERTSLNSIYFNSQFTEKSVMSKIQVMSVGYCKGDISYLLFIPETRGLAVKNSDDCGDKLFSCKALKKTKCLNYTLFDTDKFFDYCKIEELSE